MKKIYIILFAIFLLGALLRFADLGKIPTGFHVDEAYFGYNAFSILKTGREITGNFLPLNLHSLLYSPAGYSYLAIPFIVFFGLSEFSTRFPSALFGSLTIPLVYFLFKLIFKENKNKERIALISSLFLAVSPWHINLSRLSTENVLVVFFVTLGTCLYIFWLEKNRAYLLLFAFLAFAANIVIYQAARSFLPIFIPLLFLYSLYIKQINIKKLFLPIFLYTLLIIIPVIYVLFSPELSFRIRTLSIFQNPTTQLLLDEQLREDGVNNIGVIEARAFHNKISNYSTTFINNYFKHFSPEFLFTDAGLPIRYRVSSMGLLYIFDLLFILAGVYYLIKNERKKSIFILGWILIVPIGSALTFDDIPNLQRTLLVFPVLSILIAFGFEYLFTQIYSLNKKYRYFTKVIFALVPIILIYNFLFYMHSYYIHQLTHRPWYRQEGYRELVQEINSQYKQYEKVVITDSNSAPTIFLAFYNKYDPLKLQNIIKKSSKTNYGSMSFDKYEITNEKCPLAELVSIDPISKVKTTVLRGSKNVLYINDQSCPIPNEGVRIVTQIKRPDNTVAFTLLSLK